MLGPGHRVFGALAGASVATLAGQPWPMVAMTSLVATSTSNGPTSPDLDQTALWQRLTGWAPTRIRKHRGLTHWPELALLAWLLIDRLPADAHWPAYALLIGWVSHLIGDALFGEIPLGLGSVEVGCGLKTGGRLETAARFVFGLALLWVLAGTPVPGTVGPFEVSPVVLPTITFGGAA